MEGEQHHVTGTLAAERQHLLDAVTHACVKPVAEHEDYVTLPFVEERLPELVEVLAFAKEVVPPAEEVLTHRSVSDFDGRNPFSVHVMSSRSGRSRKLPDPSGSLYFGHTRRFR